MSFAPDSVESQDEALSSMENCLTDAQASQVFKLKTTSRRALNYV